MNKVDFIQSEVDRVLHGINCNGLTALKRNMSEIASSIYPASLAEQPSEATVVEFGKWWNSTALTKRLGRQIQRELSTRIHITFIEYITHNP